jgi:HEAT repeat protein
MSLANHLATTGGTDAMRKLLALLMVGAGLLWLTTVEAQVIKQADVPKYIGILKTSSSAKTRADAAEKLGHRGAIRASDVEDAIDPLINGLKTDKEAEVRAACAKALGDISFDPADSSVDALTEGLKDTSANVKMAAILSLGQFGGKAVSALDPLRAIAKNKDDKKMSQAANAAVKSITGVAKKK